MSATIKRPDSYQKTRREVTKNKKRRKQSSKRYDAVLPMEFVAEFEKRFISRSDSQTKQGLWRTSRAQKRWKSA